MGRSWIIVTRMTISGFKISSIGQNLDMILINFEMS